jgi:hypothetical protein
MARLKARERQLQQANCFIEPPFGQRQLPLIEEAWRHAGDDASLVEEPRVNPELRRRSGASVAERTQSA